MTILSSKNSLLNGIVLKRDMTREERNTDSLLLQERWHLIQSGAQTSIKINHSTIYVNKSKHGQVTNSVFSLTPQPGNNNKVPTDKLGTSSNQDATSDSSSHI